MAEHRTVFSDDHPNQARTRNLKAKARARAKTKTTNQPQRPRSPHRTIKTPPQRSQQFSKTKHKAEYKPPDSNAEQNHATTRFESKNQGDGGKIAKNLQTMSELIDSGNTNAAAETSAEPEETSYELISQLDEDQHEEYIGKITDTWNNIDDIET